MVDKSRLLRETLSQSIDSQVTADHEVPALKKMLTWLTIWFRVKKIRHRLTDISHDTGIQLRCYEITTVSLVAAFYWNTCIICKNATNLLNT